MYKKDSQTYHLQAFRDGSKSEPNGTLTKVKCINRSTTSQLARTVGPYLFPKEAPKLKRTAFKAKAQQATEHDEQQDNVGGKQGNEWKFGGLEVGHYTSLCQRIPCRANLSMGTVVEGTKAK